MVRIFAIIFILNFVGCARENSGTAQTEVPIEAPSNALALGTLTTWSNAANAFNLSISYSGDENNNAVVRAFYCVEIGCDAKSSSTYIDLKRGAIVYTGTLSNDDWEKNKILTVRLYISAQDEDGVQNFTAPGEAILYAPFSGLGDLKVSSATKSDFSVTTKVLGDSNKNSQVALSWCNQTDTPGCTPGTKAITLTRQSDGVFIGTKLTYQSADNPGDSLKIQATLEDEDGTTTSVQFAELKIPSPAGVLIELSLSELTDSSFTAVATISGDDNSNATLYMFSCYWDPFASGCKNNSTSTKMTRDGNTFTAKLGGFEFFDYVHIRISGEDPDEFSYLAYKEKTIKFINPGTSMDGRFDVLPDGAGKIKVVMPYSSDGNNNATAYFRWCNRTDNPSCVPSSPGTLMTSTLLNVVDARKEWRTQIEFKSPDDTGDTIAATVLVIDPDSYSAVYHYWQTTFLVP